MRLSLIALHLCLVELLLLLTVRPSVGHRAEEKDATRLHVRELPTPSEAPWWKAHHSDVQEPQVLPPPAGGFSGACVCLCLLVGFIVFVVACPEHRFSLLARVELECVLEDCNGTLFHNHMRLAKWLTPMVLAFAGFCFQSVFLHMTTMEYVWQNVGGTPVKPLADEGHRILGEKDVSMGVLDGISGSMAVTFVAGCLLLRDLRLWTKVLVTAGTLFVWKGMLDYVTQLPDSIGWDHCKDRLGPAGVQTFQDMKGLPRGEMFSRLMSLEMFGIDTAKVGHQTQGGPTTIWPVRYCSDMLVSGHTFVMFLFLLANGDLLRKMSLNFRPHVATGVMVASTMFTFLCTAMDLYLIVVNHFHYTIDVVLSLMLTMLLYTNAGMAVFTNWFVEAYEEKNDRHTSDNGLIWLPAFFVPFCCFTGYYAVVEHEVEALRDMRRNVSSRRKKAWDVFFGIDDFENEEAEAVLEGRPSTDARLSMVPAAGGTASSSVGDTGQTQSSQET